MNFTKPFLALALSSFLFISCKETAAESKSETSTEVAETPKEVTPAVKPETATFSIEGMTCSMGCAKTIEKELAAMDGVQSATVDFDKKTATVEFDATKQTPEKLVETVEATADGKTYKVSNLKSSGSQAMVFSQDQEKEKKETAAKKKGKASTEAKSGCCAAKKQCSADEKKAITM
ncbi:MULTISPECIES: heavy-metal-associated domain-containing protein [unclassified Flavobacterium]|uniref:heavy-metal-associated domain-containing protein n=1 Tax=Flavobacterium sp. GT3R68 TaxID=2594437 RepID=UPI000F872A28|nr:cation transporter [Flavobacterium sp. GSN2]TRW93393.1 cation transporter [Flavobacterium sp. GT3R68]